VLSTHCGHSAFNVEWLPSAHCCHSNPSGAFRLRPSFHEA
jgi:hypothetical protein